MNGEPKAGDRVEWNASGGHAKGVVVSKLTSATTIKTHRVAASPDHPEFLVKSDRGGLAAHKPSALKKSR